MSGFAHESAANETQEWMTPPWVFVRLGLTFDLDPCSPENPAWSHVPATSRFTKREDGLIRPWHGRVWVNPPYGPETGKWLARLARHGDGIALVFARCDAAWFHDAAAHAHIICFVRGRIRFLRYGGEAGDAPGAGSALLAFGEECAEAVVRADLGTCVRVVAGGGRPPEQDYLAGSVLGPEPDEGPTLFG